MTIPPPPPADRRALGGGGDCKGRGAVNMPCIRATLGAVCGKFLGRWCCSRKGWGWLGSVGPRLTACVTLSHRLDWVPTFGCLVSQPPRLRTMPKPHRRRWWEGDTAVPVSIQRLNAGGGGGAVGGFKAQSQSIVAHLSSSPAGCRPPVGGWWWGGAQCSGPQRQGRGSPTLRPLVESVGRVACGSLRWGAGGGGGGGCRQDTAVALWRAGLGFQR